MTGNGGGAVRAGRESAAGLWESPITPARAAARSAAPSEVRVDGGDIYWLESRPAEGGRAVIVRRDSSGEISEILPPPFSARSRVHEYGGGVYAAAGGVVYFSHDADGRLYRLDPGQTPRPITPEGDLRYGDLSVDQRRGRLLAVREDHRRPGLPVNELVAVDCRGGRRVEVLFSGRDFYAAPHLNPDWSRIAFLAWSLPDMPWDGTELWTAELDKEGRPSALRKVAGGREESIFQPQWSPAGQLYFVSDRTGWWNICRVAEGDIVPVCPLEAEFGLPLWSLGSSTYAFTGDGRIAAAFCRKGIWRLGVVSLPEDKLREVDTASTEISGLTARDGSVVCIAASPRAFASVVEYSPDLDRFEVILGAPLTPDPPRGRGPGEGVRIDPDFISLPEPVEFPTGEGRIAYGFFYPPRNPGFRLPEGELPPLLVVPHGGPTGAASTALSLKTQFWTSRGFAVLEVNYRGSSGFGRAYREELDGLWGVADVEDCLNGAKWLAGKGLVDPSRMAIRGSSAAGFTALNALARSDLFRAGAVYYGVSDLELLAADDHKFESGSLARLVGPYPERRDLYQARSPVHFAGRISAPMIFFQGEDDRVVPPEQTARMAAALREKKIPAEMIHFPGEGHGFRSATAIQRALEAEYRFYGRIFGFLSPPA
jgi:dipeptidyl aminopeptidase/acylaminoacyl peptidase